MRSGQHHTLVLTRAGASCALGAGTGAAAAQACRKGWLVQRPASSLTHSEARLHVACAGTLLSFGRPTYGRLGQKDAEVGSDAGAAGRSRAWLVASCTGACLSPACCLLSAPAVCTPSSSRVCIPPSRSLLAPRPQPAPSRARWTAWRASRWRAPLRGWRCRVSASRGAASALVPLQTLRAALCTSDASLPARPATDHCLHSAAHATAPRAGCFSEEGEGWLWGFGTSNQLGKGDDDEGARRAGPA